MLKVLKRDELLRPKMIENNGEIFTVKDYPVFNYAENRHMNANSQIRDYFVLVSDKRELRVSHTYETLNEDKKILNKFAKICEFMRKASNEEVAGLGEVLDAVYDLKDELDVFRLDDIVYTASIDNIYGVVALFEGTTQNWAGVTVQFVKGYADMCPFENGDRDTFCECDCPHFCDCDIHNAEWKKNKLVEQLEFYKQADMSEEVANVEEMLAIFENEEKEEVSAEAEASPSEVGVTKGKKYLCNAISGQMFSELGNCTIQRTVLEDKPDLSAYESYIGHEDLCRLLGDNVEFNRGFITLHEGDELLVAQVTGGRLTEGCTSLPDGVTIEFHRYTFKRGV